MVETYERQLEEGTDELRAGADRARQRMNDMTRKIKTQTEEAWEDLVDTVKKHPVKALGITLAAGFAAGGLIAAASAGRRRYSARDSIKDLAGTGADAWDRVRGGFEDAVFTLKDAIEEAVKKFK